MSFMVFLLVLKVTRVWRDWTASSTLPRSMHTYSLFIHTLQFSLLCFRLSLRAGKADSGCLFLICIDPTFAHASQSSGLCCTTWVKDLRARSQSSSLMHTVPRRNQAEGARGLISHASYMYSRALGRSPASNAIRPRAALALAYLPPDSSHALSYHALSSVRSPKAAYMRGVSLSANLFLTMSMATLVFPACLRHSTTSSHMCTCDKRRR
mmetsp:Transcript_6401/g.13298  ORF Transcript_6401/g.13298 Transcript_6401/m.13298 type:complete len:210 (-) Transcript_6401:3-632(-)